MVLFLAVAIFGCEQSIVFLEMLYNNPLFSHLNRECGLLCHKKRQAKVCQDPGRSDFLYRVTKHSDHSVLTFVLTNTVSVRCPAFL